MKIHFNIDYHTNWGEYLLIHLDILDREDNVLVTRQCPLETFDGKMWEGEITFPHEDATGVKYKYAVYNEEGLVWTEWEVAPHKITFDADTDSYVVNDYWCPIPDDLPLYSSAFTECIGKHTLDKLEKTHASTLQLRVVEPRLREGQRLAICGSIPQLGAWGRPIRMAHTGLQEWAVNIDASLLYHSAEYKYVIVDDRNNITQWEEGMNRKIRLPKMADKQMWIKTDKRPTFDLPKWKTAGIVIPVFSLRTNNSAGIGDFGDLKTLVAWASKVKMHVIQILPINDTTATGKWTDSYPYNAISIYAFHPIYCNLNALPRLKSKVKMEEFLIKQQNLNQLAETDYEAVFKLKMDYLRLIFAQEGTEVLKSTGFTEYFNANREWLMPYAAFCHLRNTYGTADFTKWEKHSTYVKEDVEALCDKDSDTYLDCALHFYIQYQLHTQLTEARNEARRHGIIIKGDIPIGISRTSVEAWTEPKLFNLDSQAGAPPDAFSADGQNWGFPTYNWEEMKKDGYQWWQCRFKKMAEYFDAYRIDHILGFFRIWEIPLHSVHGLLGQFAPSLPLSINEIENYGLKFRKDLMTKPYITDDSLEQIFGYRKDIIKAIYLYAKAEGRYDLKVQYNTQRKIEAAFNGKTDEESILIRDGLYRLVSSVLFIPDRHYPELYHPRISAQTDYVYQTLAKHEQDAFNRLYNDYYYKRHNNFWYDEAMQKLPILTQATRMLVCAEDLGMIPSCVAWVMERLKILSLEIQAMPKKEGCEFGNLQDNPYRSVATISTHDMSPLRLWWKEDYKRAQRFYNTILQKDGNAPKEAPDWLCEEIVSRHLFSPSCLCVLSFQDWLSMDERLRLADPEKERINIPANPHHYWRYRMHLTIERLMEAKDLNNKITALIENSGRA
ncbi:MAG: 4-alpha-glucanotransferase [Bacteroidaceae bacterium]|nr:4-alpha-glucanotransferase [Bacteroidaceae bacterium]